MIVNGYLSRVGGRWTTQYRTAVAKKCRSQYTATKSSWEMPDRPAEPGGRRGEGFTLIELSTLTC